MKVNTAFANSMKVVTEPDYSPDSACTVHDVKPHNKYQTEVKHMEQVPSAFELPPKICKRSVFKRGLSDAVIKEGNLLW